jgi:hypothetical protein
MTKDKELAIRYFLSKNIIAKHFSKKIQGKKPDFELYFENNLLGFCELKSIVEADFTGERPDPTYSKIQNKIHEATKQFANINPAHTDANVLFFINHSNTLGFQDLWYVLSGQVTPPNQPSEPIDLRYLKRLLKKDDLSKIDFIVWADLFKKRVSFTLNMDSKFTKTLKQKLSTKAFEKLNNII